MMQSPYSYASSLCDWTPFIHDPESDRDEIIFELRTAHIALLQEASWEWDENYSPGAPLGDAKRPFGNSGHWRIPVDIFNVIDDADPETLVLLQISEDYASEEDHEESATQALNGIWAECGLAMSVLLHCARQGLTAAPGSKWVVSRGFDTWLKFQEK
mgnify:CR=1 FL=1